MCNAISYFWKAIRANRPPVSLWLENLAVLCSLRAQVYWRMPLRPFFHNVTNPSNVSAVAPTPSNKPANNVKTALTLVPVIKFLHENRPIPQTQNQEIQLLDKHTEPRIILLSETWLTQENVTQRSTSSDIQLWNEILTESVTKAWLFVAAIYPFLNVYWNVLSNHFL